MRSADFGERMRSQPGVSRLVPSSGSLGTDGGACKGLGHFRGQVGAEGEP